MLDGNSKNRTSNMVRLLHDVPLSIRMYVCGLVITAGIESLPSNVVLRYYALGLLVFLVLLIGLLNRLNSARIVLFVLGYIQGVSILIIGLSDMDAIGIVSGVSTLATASMLLVGATRRFTDRRLVEL